VIDRGKEKGKPDAFLIDAVELIKIMDDPSNADQLAEKVGIHRREACAILLGKSLNAPVLLDEIQIRIPKEIYDILEFYKVDKELDKNIKLLLAVELFSRGYLTLKQASKLAELPIADFIDELNRRGIPIFEYSEEEVKKEIENVDSI